jgi:hypothetical protein
MSVDLARYAAAVIVGLWGVAHITPTPQVVAGFGPITVDNQRIIRMTWVSEGLTLVFVGALVAVVTAMAGEGERAAAAVYWACAAMLMTTAIWTAFTGSRTSVLPMKLCPLVKSAAAALLVVAQLASG